MIITSLLLVSASSQTISTPWGAETAEPIEMKIGMGDYVGDPTPHAQNENCT